VVHQPCSDLVSSNTPDEINQEEAATMLESGMMALANEDIQKRLDAYLTLSNAMKAYTDTPPLSLLKQHVNQLLKYAQRDMRVVPDASGFQLKL
jgi:hypothetical protein